MISIIIPTITGREHHLVRCMEGYVSRTDDEFEIIVKEDYPTCGAAWAQGLLDVHPDSDYIHFSADDLEPMPGWDIEAREWVSSRMLPAPRIVTPNGKLDYCGDHSKRELPDFTRVAMSVIPFLDREMLDHCLPLLETHYYSDDWISYRLRKRGFAVSVCRSYQFTHYRALEGRGAGMTEDERMTADRAVFLDAISREDHP